VVLLKSFGALFRDVRLVPAKSLAEAAPSEVTSSFVGCAGDKSPVIALPIYGRAGLVTEQRRNNVRYQRVGMSDVCRGRRGGGTGGRLCYSHIINIRLTTYLAEKVSMSGHSRHV
jgi:hypothetical protein